MSYAFWSILASALGLTEYAYLRHVHRGARARSARSWTFMAVTLVAAVLSLLATGYLPDQLRTFWRASATTLLFTGAGGAAVNVLTAIEFFWAESSWRSFVSLLGAIAMGVLVVLLVEYLVWVTKLRTLPWV